MALIRCLGTTLVLGLIAWPSHAQESDQYRTCNDSAKTQTEMHVCASEEAARVDAKLNDLYRTLLKAASTERSAVRKIRAAERAWVTYRDAYIDAMYPAPDKQAEYGSIYPTEVNLLRAKLTQEHVEALKQLLEQYIK
jgi:uncharacterized protein YecT (DUF1311 family)